jgi:hypothetical protein
MKKFVVEYIVGEAVGKAEIYGGNKEKAIEFISKVRFDNKPVKVMNVNQVCSNCDKVMYPGVGSGLDFRACDSTCTDCDDANK